jgi:cyanophycinase-like exopeptidase
MKNPVLLMGGDDNRDIFFDTLEIFFKKFKNLKKIAFLMEEFSNYQEWIPDFDKKIKKMGFTETAFYIPKYKDEYDEKNIINMISWADCIFIYGGNAYYYHIYYNKENIRKAILEQIKKNKPVIGLSAGAMLLSSYFLFCNDFIEYKNKKIKLYPWEFESEKEELPLVFDQAIDAIPYSIVDVHFIQRARYYRLFNVVSFFFNEHKYPITGIGIDANCSLFIEDFKNFEVLGENSTTLIYPSFYTQLKKDNKQFFPTNTALFEAGSSFTYNLNLFT